MTHARRTPASGTRHAPARVRRRTTRVRDTARALAAILALAVLLVGIPALLRLVAPTVGGPDGGWGGLLTALTRPDDGHLFLAALAVAAWAGWAVFAASVAVEVLAVLRGLPTPRLPVIAGPQRLAASLVASAAMLLTSPAAAPQAPPGTAAVLAEGPAPTAQPTATLTATGPAAADGRHEVAEIPPRPAVVSPRAAPAISAAPLPARAAHARHREITVHRGDTLWDLAATHLGEGARYREIARLNYGRPQPDGRTLTDAHWIYPGWTLLLPDDRPEPDAPTTSARRGPNKTQPTGTHAADGGTYTIRAGDTLWDIAATHLGDPLRYREIYQLNHGRTQPDGGSLQDPLLILPGWRLALPPRHSAERPTVEPPTVAPPTVEPPARPRPGAETPAPAIVPGPRRTPPPDAAATHAGQPATSQAPVQRPSGAGTESRPETVGDAGDSSPVDISRLVLGMTALTATGLFAELARRRRRQQQHRLPGERIPMPTGDPATAERRLRAAQVPVTLDTVTTALTRLADNARAAGRPLPRVLLVLVGLHEIEIVVADEDAPVAPFVAAGTDVVARLETPHACWRLDPGQLDQVTGPDDVTPRARPTIPCSAYPALVAVGTVEDRMLLLNLEAAGTLTVKADPGTGEAIVRTLAVELATSPLSAGITLILPDGMRDLADVADPDRVAAVDPAAGRRRASVRAASTRAALDRERAGDLHQARTQGAAADAWTPEIYIGLDGAAIPWSGIAAIRAAQPDAAEDGWRLEYLDGGSGRLAPFGLELQPSHLADDDYASLLSLLGTATEASSPAPSAARAAVERSGGEAARSPHDQREVREPDGHEPARAAALTSRRVAVLAALPELPTDAGHTPVEDAENSEAPRILLLGRVDVIGATAPSSSRRGRSIELLAYLALHPGAAAAEIDEAIWPGQRVTDDMRNSLAARTRTWLGTDSVGFPYLAHVTAEGGYRLHPAVRTDWHRFVHLARLALSDAGRPDLVEAALALVRGRPFLGVPHSAYAWAEGDQQTMISSIVDVALEAARTCEARGRLAAARGHLGTALAIDPLNIEVQAAASRLAQLQGDDAERHRLATRFREQLRSIDPDADLDDAVLQHLGAEA